MYFSGEWLFMVTIFSSTVTGTKDYKADVGSSIAETSPVMSSASLPSVYGDITSTAGPWTITLQRTTEKERTSLNKGNLSVQAASKAPSKETAADSKATRFESDDQSRDSLSTEKATSYFSISTALDLIPSNDKPPIVVSTSIAANYTVLLGSPAVLPSKLTNFREPSPTVDSGFTSRDLYSTSSVVPVWTANMLGNAYGGGYVVTPSIFMTSFPGSPSSSGIPPGYELSSNSEDFQSSRSPMGVSVAAGGVLTLVAGPSKEEATLGVSTSASALDALPTSGTDAASSNQISSSASNHKLLKPVAGTKPSLASTIPINETEQLNTSLLLPAASVKLGLSPLISPLVNQSVIGAYFSTSVPEFQGLSFKITVDFSLVLICIAALLLFL